MKPYRTGTYLGLVSLLYVMPALAVASEPAHTISHNDMENMNHSSMDMAGMSHNASADGSMNHGATNHDSANHDAMDTSDMEHSYMDHSSMDHGSMDHDSMDHGSMDMSDMQGGQPPADARSPDYSNGVGYGRFGKPTMMGDTPTWGISVSDLGYNFEEDTVNFETEAWYGEDEQRIVLKSEGDIETNETKGDNKVNSLTSLSYWQPMGIFWNTHVGAAYDTAVDDVALMFGIEGTAPYFIETSADTYVYSDGQIRLDTAAEYEWRLNQHWVVIPEAELTAFAKDDDKQHIARGFNELEAKVRLTYEMLNRQVSPYVGVSYETALGANRGLRRAHGESVDSSSVIAGLSFWF